jgi:two-component system, NtrC family, response regulator GlrR
MHQGAIEIAHGGTVFLDEIGELDAELQPKFLRFLEAGEVQRIGSTTRIPVDVRIIAATHRNLRQAVNAHRFRSDLFFRLAVFELAIPPLRARLDDLPLLLQTLIQRMEIGDHPRARELGSAAELAKLAQHRWPGNIRELRNYLERFLVLGGAAPLDLPTGDHPPGIDTRMTLRDGRERWVSYFERKYLEGLLQRMDGNVTAAAREAKIDRIHFHRLLRRAGLR